MLTYLFIAFVIIWIPISLRRLFTTEQLKDPPQYRLLSREESDTMQAERIDWYQSEAERLDFFHLGDFQLILGEIKDSKGGRPLKRWERVLLDKSGTTFAIASLSGFTGIVRLELITYFDDGRQHISGNYVMRRQAEFLLPGVTSKLYPECCFEDLVHFHQEEVRRLSLSAGPVSYAGFRTSRQEFVDKRAREFKDILDYNVSKGVFVKSNREGYYQLSMKAVWRSFRSGGPKSEPAVGKNVRGKAYRTGFTGPETGEKYLLQERCKRWAMAFVLVPVAAAAYKLLAMIPDTTGYFTLIWVSVLMWIGHAVFISLRLDRTIIYLYLVYYAQSILGVLIILWNATPNFLSVALMFVLIAFAVAQKARKGKPWSQRSVAAVIGVILLAMVFPLQRSFRFILRIHSLRNLDPQTVAGVRFYAYQPGRPFDIAAADAEKEITRPDRLAAFTAALSDMSPYLPDRDRMKGVYIASIVRKDGRMILIPLGKGNRKNPDAAFIKFFTAGYLRHGSGLYSHGEYQSKKLYAFIDSLNLEKWQDKEAPDN